MEKSNIKPPAQTKFPMVRFLTAISRLVVLFIMVVLMGILSKDFFSISNLLNILRQAAPIFIIAAGQTVIILARGNRPLDGCGGFTHRCGNGNDDDRQQGAVLFCHADESSAGRDAWLDQWFNRHKNQASAICHHIWNLFVIQRTNRAVD